MLVLLLALIFWQVKNSKKMLKMKIFTLLAIMRENHQ